MRARTSSRSSLAAAYMMAVLPSAPGAFGLAPLLSKRRAAARSPRSAASSSVGSAADGSDAEASHTATTATRDDLDIARMSINSSTLDECPLPILPITWFQPAVLRRVQEDRA